MTTPEKKKAMTVKDAAAELHRHIFESGWASRADLLKVADAAGFGVDMMHKGISLLQRQKHITQTKGPNLDEMGFETLHESKQVAAKFGRPSPPMTLRMMLRTKSHGPISLNGHWFNLERDNEGLVMCRAAGFRAMVRKAHEKLGLSMKTETQDAITKTAIDRMSVRFLGVSLNGHERPAIGITRPVARGQAVGELVHESLPEGSTIDWRIRWPMPPYTQEVIAELLDECQDIGFSAAGNGKGGGVAGVFRWVDFAETDYSPVPKLAEPADPKDKKENESAGDTTTG